MQIDEYLMHYEKFQNEFGIDTSPKARSAKLIMETCELIEAEHKADDTATIDEAIDVMNCSIALVVAHGVKNPLHAGYMKLQRTAEKYRRETGGR
ncbi:MAG: hypothetical protein PHI31_09725 [Desulfuromonadaceae bacterium]|nr:hypothetical protein [Desulfuromonadaceae bacterium]